MHPIPNHSIRRRSAMAVPILIILLSMPGSVTAKQFSGWGSAVPETSINSAQADGCPIESPDGLSLYFASNRDPVGGAADSNDIYVAERPSTVAEFGPAVRLPPPVNSTAADFCPTPLNGKYLLFVSARSGGCGAPPGGDIYLTRNHPAHGWLTPVNLGCHPTGPNTAGGEFSPSLVETAEGTLLFFSSPGTNGLQDIYVSTQQADGSFGPGTPVAELNTPFADQMPNVSRDGLEIVFSSNRTGTTGTSLDVYTAHRASTSDLWSMPENVGSNVNTAADETRASLSGDGERLHFGRSGDIYVSTRTKVTGSD
jgi:hypothetical protein